MLAGARVLPYRSNIPRISEFCFSGIDETYPHRALSRCDRPGAMSSWAVAQLWAGLEQEHAALAPRYLGLRLVLARDFARIHWQNLVNFGVLPLKFENGAEYDAVEPGDRIWIRNVQRLIQSGPTFTIELERHAGGSSSLGVRHDLSAREIELLLAGGLINRGRSALSATAPGRR